MPNKKVTKTIQLQGKEYAQVSERLKQFREDCPRGKILTKDTLDEGGQRKFKAWIWKDKKDYIEALKVASGNTDLIYESADANGTALGVVKAQKDFEKLETIAVGRALAMLGYLASGEIASFEEMEEYYKDQEEKKANYVQEQVDLFDNAKSLEELRELWSLTNKAIPEIQEAKDKRKAELEKRATKEGKDETNKTAPTKEPGVRDNDKPKKEKPNSKEGVVRRADSVGRDK